MTGGRQPLAVTSGPRPPGTVDTQNARIRTASIVTGIEPESAQSGGSRALAIARDHDAVLWRLSNVSDLIADFALPVMARFLAADLRRSGYYARSMWVFEWRRGRLNRVTIAGLRLRLSCRWLWLAARRPCIAEAGSDPATFIRSMAARARTSGTHLRHGSSRWRTLLPPMNGLSGMANFLSKSHSWPRLLRLPGERALTGAGRRFRYRPRIGTDGARAPTVGNRVEHASAVVERANAVGSIWAACSARQPVPEVRLRVAGRRRWLRCARQRRPAASLTVRDCW